MFPVKFMGKLICIRKLIFSAVFLKNLELSLSHYGKNAD